VSRRSFPDDRLYVSVNSPPQNNSADLLCHQKWGCKLLDPSCLSNSRVLYRSQQAVIFSNRATAALRAAKGTQVCQAWPGRACPALWYGICSLSLLHGLCVLLLWASPVLGSESLQGEEGRKAAELEQDVSLGHSEEDAGVLCLLPPS